MPVKIGADTPATAVKLIGDNVAPRILMIVTDKDSLDTDTEQRLKRELTAYFGATIDVAQSDADIDSGNWRLSRYDLIIVCNGIAPADVNNLKSVEVPVISMEEDVSVTALNMAATGGASSETQTNATDITHQVISEALRAISPSSIAIGNKTVYKSSSNIDFITTLGTGGVSIAEDVGTATEEHIVIYEEDAVLQDATTAEEIRIHFGLYQFNQLTPTGKSLFRQVVMYAIYGATRQLVEIETRLEAVQDALTALIRTGGGTFGMFPGMPIFEHERGIFWFKPAGTGAGDATTAADAATGAYDNVTVYGTAGQDDVFLYVNGSFNFNGAVGGLAASIARASIFFLGQTSGELTNSNAGATYVIYITAANIEFAGAYFNEATITVEDIVTNTTATGVYIHDCIFRTSAENGIHLSNTIYAIIKDNMFDGQTNDGIELSGGSSRCSIIDNEFVRVGNNAINLNGDNVDNNFVYDNIINGGAGTTDTGINIALGDDNVICGNTIVEVGTALKADTGSNNGWEDNKGTLETDWTTALDGNVQDFFGTGAAHKQPLNTTGIVRIYPDYNSMGAADIVAIVINRKNDGTNSRVSTSFSKAGVQTMPAPVYEIRYTKTRTVHFTVQRTAGTITTFPIGIEEAVS